MLNLKKKKKQPSGRNSGEFLCVPTELDSYQMKYLPANSECTPVKANTGSGSAVLSSYKIIIMLWVPTTVLLYFILPCCSALSAY